MRPFMFAVALAIAPLAASSSALAQPPDAGTPEGFDVERRLTELQARVGLDATQVPAVRTILEDARRQMEALRASAGAGPRDGRFRDARRAILFQVEDRIWALLSCTQKDAFRLYIREQMVERHARREEHGPHGRHGGRGRGR